MSREKSTLVPGTLRELAFYISSDLARYRATGASSVIRVMLFTQGFWASTVFRISTYLFVRFRHLVFPGRLVSALNMVALKMMQIITGISIPVGSRIGAGLYIGHCGGIIISSKAVLGSNCNISPQVVIGFSRKEGRFGVPVLGDRVFVGPGAKILGPLHIGDDVAVGANSVVLCDVPRRSVVAGIPAKVINRDGSFDYIFYPGMESDPRRARSIAEGAS